MKLTDYGIKNIRKLQYPPCWRGWVYSVFTMGDMNYTKEQIISETWDCRDHKVELFCL
jgi:hypothetical protein